MELGADDDFAVVDVAEEAGVVVGDDRGGVGDGIEGVLEVRAELGGVVVSAYVESDEWVGIVGAAVIG